MLNDKRINGSNLLRPDSTAALTVACSFCVRSGILSALIRSPYSRESTEALAAAARTRTWLLASQAPVPAVTSAASESATAAAASTSDDCCEVCFVAPRVLALHWCTCTAM